MKTSMKPLEHGAALLAVLCTLASPAAAIPRTAANGQLASTATTATTHGLPSTTSTANRDDVCTCTATYSDGSSEDLDACARSECPTSTRTPPAERRDHAL